MNFTTTTENTALKMVNTSAVPLIYAALEQAGYKRKKMRDGKYIIGIQLTYGILD